VRGSRSSAGPGTRHRPRFGFGIECGGLLVGRRPSSPGLGLEPGLGAGNGVERRGRPFSWRPISLVRY